MSEITGGIGAPAWGREIALTQAELDREIAAAQRKQQLKDAADGVERREVWNMQKGRFEIQTVRLDARAKVPARFQQTVVRAEADEQQARIALARAEQDARLYIERHNLAGPAIRWSGGDAELGGPSGKSAAELHFESATAPARAELDRATARRERAVEAYGEQVRAYADLERTEADIAAEQDADDVAYASRRAQREVRLLAARARCAT